MPIQAQRFKFSDNETNVAVSDFVDSKTSDLFNSPNNVMKDIDSDMSDFLGQAKAAADIELKKPESLDALARQAKDAWTSVKDISQLGQNDLNKYADGLFPNNPAAVSAYKKLSQSCKTSSSGHYNSGKPFDTNVDCNGKGRASQGGCTSGISDILNKLSGGSYNSAYRDLNSALSNLVSLATMGYKANMCGVFTALSGGITSDLVKSRGASMLLGTLGSTSNLRGLFDLGASTPSSFPITKDLPSGIGNVFNNYKVPFDAKQTEFGSLADATDLTMGGFDTNWNKSSYDNIASCSFMDKPNADYESVLRGKAMEVNIDENDLNFIPTSSTNLMRSGVSSLGLFA